MPVLSDAPFYSPLKTSLILQNGSGNPTFTRATGRTTFDNEGKLITLPSGAVAFDGARCIVNLFPGNTDNLSGLTLGRMTSTNSAAADADGGNKAGEYTATNVVGEHYVRLQTAAYNGRSINISVKISLTSYRWICIRVDTAYNFYDLQAQSWVGTLQGISRKAVVAGGWVRLQMSADVADGTPVYSINITDSSQNLSWTPAGIEKITVYQCQLCDVTGKSVPTVDDYVSKGVLSAPWHGAGADGVKYFDIDTRGVAIPASTLKGAKLRSAAVTNTALWCRNFTNAAWVKTNVTAALTQTGIDGQTNACSLLTASAADGTALQSITAASSAGCSGFYIKRSSGTGSVYITRDGGTNWTDITSSINSSTFTLVKLENSSVLNPQVGIKIATSGDAVIVDYGINHLGTEIASPILTTSAAVTVNAETLTYQTSGNFSDTAGTIIATVERANWANNNGVVVGKAGSGLSTSSSNSGVQALDGTNTVDGPAGSTITRRKIGMKWSGSAMKTFAGGNFGTAGSYDGSFGLGANIAIMPQSNGYIKDLAIWQTELSDADMLAVASEQTDCSMAVSFAAAMYANVIYSVSASMPFSFVAAVNASVIHSVSAAMDVDFTDAMYANVIHSVSAVMPVTFGTDFESTWISPAFTINATYERPEIIAEYSIPVINATYIN